MTVEYRIAEHSAREGQTCIETVIDGEVRCRSYAPVNIDPACRLNVHHPEAVDESSGATVAYRVPNKDEAAKFGWDHNAHREMATYAAVLEVVPLDDAANAVGLTPDDLVAEAEGWAAAAQLD